MKPLPAVKLLSKPIGKGVKLSTPQFIAGLALICVATYISVAVISYLTDSSTRRQAIYAENLKTCGGKVYILPHPSGFRLIPPVPGNPAQALGPGDTDYHQALARALMPHSNDEFACSKFVPF
jgi:hypothetical protein